MTTGGYFINGYWWLFYKWLLVIIINGYWWLFCKWLLVIILLMVIDGYYINGY